MVSGRRDRSSFSWLWLHPLSFFDNVQREVGFCSYVDTPDVSSFKINIYFLEHVFNSLVHDKEASLMLRSVGRSAGRRKSLVQQDLSKSTLIAD